MTTKNINDVNKIDVNFMGNKTLSAENRGIKKNLTAVINGREHIKPVIGTDWLQKINWTKQNFESATKPTDE